MRICLIGGVYLRGGGRKDTLKIAPETTLESGLRAAGHEVTTLSHYDGADFGRFDVVHVHHLSWGAMRLASDRSPAPFVFTSHDLARMCGHPEPLLRRAAMRWAFSRADGIVALSHLELSFQRRAYQVDGAIQAVIPNGIDGEIYSFQRENRAGRGRPWQLLYVGQLLPHKGVDILLRALAKLDINADLNLAYHVDAMEDSLRSLAGSLGLAARVRFLGRQEPAQLAALYHSCDVLILPSAWEALPSVISEAMLCGLPFVAMAGGGIPEQAGGFGYLLPLEQRNESALAAAIGQVLQHYEQYSQAGESMSRQARERFSIPAMIQGHVELYRRVATSGRTPRRQRGIRAAASPLVRLTLRRLCQA